MRINLLVLLLLVIGCSKNEARRPINPKPSTTIFSETVDEARKLRLLEDKSIRSYIASDSTRKYIQSESGFWYSYDTKLESDLRTPQPGDTIRFSYDVKTLQDSLLYDKEELGIVDYIVDKQDQITGVQRGIKLMKEGETITFIFPSYTAYGSTGDGKKIGIYHSLKSTITLLNIK